MVDSRALATVSGVALTVSFWGSSMLTSAALIAGGTCPVVTGDTIGCSSISWITTEDLGDALVTMLVCLCLK